MAKNAYVVKYMIRQKLVYRIFAIVTMLLMLPTPIYACFTNQSTWVNCTIVANRSGLSSIINTDKVNAPWFFTLLYVAIYISIAIYLLKQDRSFARFNAITFIGMLVGIVFRMYSLIGTATVTASVAVFGLTVLASMLFR